MSGDIENWTRGDSEAFLAWLLAEGLTDCTVAAWRPISACFCCGSVQGCEMPKSGGLTWGCIRWEEGEVIVMKSLRRDGTSGLHVPHVDHSLLGNYHHNLREHFLRVASFYAVVNAYSKKRSFVMSITPLQP